MAKSFPAATTHGPIEEVFPDVFFVCGTIRMFATMVITRNMVVVREGEELTVINAVRLNDEWQKKLDALGKVKHVMKIGHFHGYDDPYYVDRYQAKLWALPGHEHKGGLKTDIVMDENTELPFSSASLFVYKTPKMAESVIHLKREGGILIACDSLQHFISTRGCSLTGGLMMRMLGFVKPANIGPGWIKLTEPGAKDFERLLALDFKHLLSAHGNPLKDKAYQGLSASIERIFGIKK